MLSQSSSLCSFWSEKNGPDLISKVEFLSLHECSSGMCFAQNSLPINLIITLKGGTYLALWLKGEGFSTIKEKPYCVLFSPVVPKSRNQGNFTAIKVKCSKHQLYRSQLWWLCECADYWDDEIITTSKIEQTH